MNSWDYFGLDYWTFKQKPIKERIKLYKIFLRATKGMPIFTLEEWKERIDNLKEAAKPGFGLLIKAYVADQKELNKEAEQKAFDKMQVAYDNMEPT